MVMYIKFMTVTGTARALHYSLGGPRFEFGDIVVDWQLQTILSPSNGIWVRFPMWDLGISTIMGGV